MHELKRSSPYRVHHMARWRGKQPAYSLSGARTPNGLPGKGGTDKLRIPNYENTVDQHMSEAFGILLWILERGAVNDARRIKDGDIRVGADFDPPLPAHHRHSRFETLRRHNCHLAKRVHQRERFLFAHIAAEHARVRPRAARMTFAAGDHA